MKTEPEWAARWFGSNSHGLTDAQRRVVEHAIARIGGSWRFISGFCLFLCLWALGNLWLSTRAFDPYPFIFLNLLLSMLAATQAPIIMMAQNRQSQHDRITAGHDYEVNLKAEIEIMALHDTLDQLRNDQLAALLGCIEALGEDIRRLDRNPGANDEEVRPR